MSGKFEIRRSMAVLALVAASVGGGLVASMAVHSPGSSVPVFVSTAQAAAVEPQQMLSFSGVVKRTAPAVVQIDSTKVIKASDQRRGNSRSMPFDDPFFRRFFGDGDMPQPRDRREQGLGSGVIVNSDGYILTNNHVVEGATSVKVTTSDRREYTAKVIGTDSQTDVALLKVDGKNLPSLSLSGNKPDVGDLVLAIGNPFGIGQTVTMGIVSATGRNLGGRIEAYEDFIQTDAAINPGNSGGALINTRGELIGINTAIIPGGGGGNQGIGFAVPVTLAKNVMDQLMRSGKVTRGYIGAYLQDVDPNLAKAFKLGEARGVAITNVDSGTPADKAGLKSGDVVTQVNGEPVADVNSLRLRIASMAPGTNVKFGILRDGRAETFNVTLGERPENNDGTSRSRGNRPGSNQGRHSALEGVSVDDLTPQMARQLNLDRGTTGVVVTEVDESSAAAEAGLERGDVIMQVNRTNVKSADDFDRLARQSSGSTLLMVNRQGRTFFVAIESK